MDQHRERPESPSREQHGHPMPDPEEQGLASSRNGKKTELAKTIPDAYEATEIRPEGFEVLYPLRADVGPVPGHRTS